MRTGNEPMPNRLFAIGDIHGCSVALKTLIDAIDPQAEDTIVVLGDVIDFGPDTKGGHSTIDRPVPPLPAHSHRG